MLFMLEGGDPLTIHLLGVVARFIAAAYKCCGTAIGAAVNAMVSTGRWGGGVCARRGMPNLRLGMACGRGHLAVVVQVGALVPGLLLVEFSRARGHAVDFLQFWTSILPLVRSTLPLHPGPLH